MPRLIKGGMTGDEAVSILKHTGNLNLLTRTIKFDENGKKISDTITDYVNGITYPTGSNKKIKI